MRTVHQHLPPAGLWDFIFRMNDWVLSLLAAPFFSRTGQAYVEGDADHRAEAFLACHACESLVLVVLLRTSESPKKDNGVKSAVAKELNLWDIYGYI